MDGGIFWLQFIFDTVAILHYIQIWTLRTNKFALFDGVLAFQLYSAVNSVAEKHELNWLLEIEGI
jgi:hypothetical protein